MTADLVIKDATVVDGSGRPAFPADVVVTGGRISHIGSLPGDVEAATVLDAAGQVLAPGFIDLHTHSDVALLQHGSGVNKVCQGVTTEITGNCGFSAFPLDDRRHDLHRELLAALDSDRPEFRWRDFDGYARAIEAAAPIQNVGCLVGHGSLRIAVAGVDQAALDGDASNQMEHLLDESLEQGALGFTTGLTYVPSMFGSAEEIARLGRVAAARNALYATHARVVAGQEIAALDEAMTVGRESGVRVEFSHLSINTPDQWGTAAGLLTRFDDAAAAGLDIRFDVYPYAASASTIAQYLPVWIQQAGPAGTAEILGSPAPRERALRDVSAGWYGGIPWLWDRVLVTQSSPHDHENPGRTVAQLAAAAAEDPEQTLLRLYATHGHSMQVAMFYRTEADMLDFLVHPASAIGSDGQAMALDRLNERPHPRFYGTYPRVLGRYVREQGRLSIEGAVRKMSAQPADRFGLRNRGYVRVGYAADLVLFSPADVTDNATFVESNRLPTGIGTVIVNGRVVVEQGAWNGAYGGRVLRHHD